MGETVNMDNLNVAELDEQTARALTRSLCDSGEYWIIPCLTLDAIIFAVDVWSRHYRDVASAFVATASMVPAVFASKRGMTPDQLAAIMTEHGRRVSASALAKRDIVILCDREETSDVQAMLAAWRAWMTASSMSPN